MYLIYDLLKDLEMA